MHVYQMRDEIAKQYPSESWRARLYAMPDHQVIAIYRRLQSKGIIK